MPEVCKVSGSEGCTRDIYACEALDSGTSCIGSLLHAELTELLTLLGSPFFLSTISVTSHEAHLLELMAAMTVSNDWPSALRSTNAPQ